MTILLRVDPPHSDILSSIFYINMFGQCELGHVTSVTYETNKKTNIFLINAMNVCRAC